jgi:hypothetical protein
MGEQVVRHREQSVAGHRETTARKRGRTNDTAIFPILHCKQGCEREAAKCMQHIMYNNTLNSTCPHNWIKAKPRRKQAGRQALTISPTDARN